VKPFLRTLGIALEVLGLGALPVGLGWALFNAISGHGGLHAFWTARERGWGVYADWELVTALASAFFFGCGLCRGCGNALRPSPQRIDPSSSASTST